MSIMDPRKPAVPQSGTFNGNPVTMEAGRAAMELLTDEAFVRVNRLGDRLREGFEQVFAETGVPGQVGGMGSLVGFIFSREPVTNFRSLKHGDADRQSLVHLALLNRGVFVAPRGLIAVSTVTTATEIDEAIAAFRIAVTETAS